jgi:hypothetical protein
VFIVDLSDPEAPVSAGSIDMGSRIYHATAAGHYAYLTGYSMTEGELYIFDVSNPAQPVQVSVCSIGFVGGLVFDAGLVYLWSSLGLEIVDVHTATAPFVLGNCSLGEICDIKLFGSYAFAASGTIGLAIFDVSDPAQPTLAAQVSQGGTAYSVAAQEPYVYPATAIYDLLVVDVTDPTSPAIVGTYNGGPTENAAYRGGYVFLSEYSTIKAVDVRQPNAPFTAGTHYDSGVDYTDLAPMGAYLVVGTDGDGLLIYKTNLPLAGDMTCDGTVGFGDINPFVLALSNSAAYQATFPDCPRDNGDINFDERVNFGDINPFVALLIAAWPFGIASATSIPSRRG